jgi:hypothetical protein
LNEAIVAATHAAPRAYPASTHDAVQDRKEHHQQHRVPHDRGLGMATGNLNRPGSDGGSTLEWRI